MMPVIDAHSHIVGDDAAVLSMLEDLGVHCFNICVARVGLTCDVQRQNYAQVAEDHPERYDWITAFEVPDFDDPNYVDRVIEQLDRDFANGAIGCKVWKNIGMEIKTPEGGYMQIDHPLLTPIFEHIERCDRTLLAHIGEPYACWQPLSYDSPHAPYYKEHPQWHMYNKPGVPGFEEISQAFDRLIERHRGLRIVGAHLGSQEYDLRAIARRFDRFPNYAVDTGARNYDLAFMDPGDVTEFLQQYPDRVLFGIDLGMPHSSHHEPAQRLRMIEEYRKQFNEARYYFCTDETFAMRDRVVSGIRLSEDLQERLLLGNALHWYRCPVLNGVAG